MKKETIFFFGEGGGGVQEVKIFVEKDWNCELPFIGAIIHSL